MASHQEKIWELLSLKLSGEASEEELAELEALLKDYPEAGFQIEILEKLWRSKYTSSEAVPKDSFNKHLQRLSNHLSGPTLQYSGSHPPDDQPPPPQKTGRFRVLWLPIGVAASLIFLCLSLYWGKDRQQGVKPAQSISTRFGSKSKIQLPDGTEVWLNSGSKLTYDELFLGGTREVSLEGEAYFDVAEDKEHPFIIHTNAMDIKVLGTAFNVRSYSDEKTTEAALIRGTIEVVLHNNPDKRILLKPSEKLVVQNPQEDKRARKTKRNQEEIPLITISKVRNIQNDSVVLETSWVANKLAFDNETLEQIALKIGRWYNVSVQIPDDGIKHITYTGVFEDESLEEVLTALQIAGSFSRYTINKRVVRIDP